jgi:hypothetical protein
MKIRAFYFFVLTLLLLVGIYSCQKEDVMLPDNKIGVNPEDTIGRIVLGKKLENPYSVKNMRKALESLKKKKLVKAEDVEELK